MGDKSPKSKAKNDKQSTERKRQEQVAHDKKQAPPSPTKPK